MSTPIRVLIVDDSALIRQFLTKVLDSSPDIEVVGSAADPLIARDKIKALNPDVLTLDVEMPRMDGLTFLRNLMRLRPMPVVMISSLTEKGANVTMDALEIGAVDFVTKPQMDVLNTFQGYADELVSKVKAAALATPQPHLAPTSPPLHSANTASLTAQKLFKTTDKVIAIGASTGGTEAIKDVLMCLPPDCPGIVIAQHIPPRFSEAFADRMDRATALRVKEAEDGDHVIPGHVFIAPGDKHLKLIRNGARYECKLDDGEPVNRHKPSVDVLFRSVITAAGVNAVAALLTGMGADGAEGLLELKNAGVHTIAQDEKTSVVWGMPGEAVKRGAAKQVLPLLEIPGALVTEVQK